MEDIYQVIFFVTFAVIAFVIRVVKKETEAPDVRPFTPMEEMKEYAVEKEVKPHRNKPRKKEVKSATSSPKAPVTDNKKIRLSSREEAKRAFIYSEIFNRKY